MATSLGYTPPTPADTGPQDDLDDLVAALHESGLLRAAAGGVRTYPQVLLMLMNVVDGRSLRSLMSLAGAAGDLDPDTSERLATGVRRARRAALEATTAPPEGPIALWRRLRDPDTRRGITAALAAVAALGSALRDSPHASEPPQ